ncbi:MAG: hypothetical protein RBR09_02665, partial [Desulfobulbaceae bacterium]|jgi:predicted kinase|nr:hypothetical protein [Desulfobulbaceae bacterium]
MKEVSMKTVLIALFVVLIGQFAHSSDQGKGNPVVEDILRDVVDQAIEDGKRIVKENTGIDLSKRGYEDRRKDDKDKGRGYDDGRDASDRSYAETRRELDQLSEEHDRKIEKLEEELNRKLLKARNEFAHEAEKEDKPDKIAEKRTKLEEKVDKAYSKFDEKIREENRRYDKKRDEILEKAR